MVITSRWRCGAAFGNAVRPRALPSIVEALRDPRRRICAAARRPRAPHGDTAIRRRLAKKKAPPGFPGGALSRTLRRTCIAAARLRA
ncbi:hypothetical protein C6Q28_04370 [Burkholderia multivorans]|nr:hypothetical protein C6Q28_04370 [Burkholderia multivorans]